VDFRRLAPHARLPAKLGLRYAELSRASLEALVEHPAAEALETLDLERVALHDEVGVVLARSQRLRRLHTLNVDGTGIGDAGASALGQCATARLTDLDISNNPITTLGLANVVAGHALRRLRYFDRTNPVATLRRLCVGPLGAHGMRILVESSALARLRELHVSDPDPALGRLSFPELVVLRVFATMPLAVRRAILQRALPALVVNE
jgi:Leucine Rich repeat